MTLTSGDLGGGIAPIYALAARDTTAPGAPSKLDLTGASESGASATDNLTRKTDVTLTGLAEAGATVTLLENVTALASGIADAAGR